MTHGERGNAVTQLHLSGFRRPRSVGPTGARQPKIPARLAFRTPARRYHALGGMAFLRRAHHFFEFKTWSATIRFKRAFSSRKAFNSFSSSISMAPYCCFQR